MVSVHSTTISCLSIIVKKLALLTIHLEIVNQIQLNRNHQFYQTTVRHYTLLLSKHLKLSGENLFCNFDMQKIDQHLFPLTTCQNSSFHENSVHDSRSEMVCLRQSLSTLRRDIFGFLVQYLIASLLPTYHLKNKELSVDIKLTHKLQCNLKQILRSKYWRILIFEILSCNLSFTKDLDIPCID